MKALLDKDHVGAGFEIFYRGDGSFFKLSAGNPEVAKRYATFVALLPSQQPLQINVDFQ